MTFQVPAEAAERLAGRIALIKRKMCAAARRSEEMDRDAMYEFFKDRFLGLGFDIDGPDFGLDSEIPVDDMPRGPARPGYRWVRGSDGKWRQVKQNTSGGG